MFASLEFDFFRVYLKLAFKIRPLGSYAVCLKLENHEKIYSW